MGNQPLEYGGQNNRGVGTRIQNDFLGSQPSGFFGVSVRPTSQSFSRGSEESPEKVQVVLPETKTTNGGPSMGVSVFLRIDPH